MFYMDLSQKVQHEELISISVILSADEGMQTLNSIPYQGPKSRGLHSQASNQPCLPLSALPGLVFSPITLKPGAQPLSSPSLLYLHLACDDGSLFPFPCLLPASGPSVFASVPIMFMIMLVPQQGMTGDKFLQGSVHIPSLEHINWGWHLGIIK